jgi:hypothetical protein
LATLMGSRLTPVRLCGWTAGGTAGPNAAEAAAVVTSSPEFVALLERLQRDVAAAVESHVAAAPHHPHAASGAHGGGDGASRDALREALAG